LGQGSETIAHIDTGAIIDSGAVSVNSGNATSHINLVGAVQKARSVGIGISVGFTLVERDTEAAIGKRITDDDQSVGTGGTTIDSTGLTISATNDGKIWGIGLAGAVIFEGSQPPPA